jgi:hypothetical protein
MLLRTTSPLRRLAASFGLVTAVLLNAVPASAGAVSPGVVPVGPWASSCAGTGAQYCVERVTVTAAGGVAQPAPKLDVRVSATDDLTAFDWSINGWKAQSAAVRTGEVTLVVRTGRFVPRFTSAAARDIRVSRTVDSAGNFTMTVTGRPVHVAWDLAGEYADFCTSGWSCGEDDSMARPGDTGYRFEGRTQDLEGYGTDFLTAMDGSYVATGA